MPQQISLFENRNDGDVGKIPLGGIKGCVAAKIQLAHKFEEIISLENLFSAWREFLVGKKKKKDVQEFSRNLADNILSLHDDLANKTYCHGGYKSFYVTDPKLRHIHKASVRDRLLHHAVYRILYPFFDKIFIADSYSCRLGKGTHKAINRFKRMIYIVSKNNTRTCWILKCDIKKFFASINHKILIEIIEQYITDKDILWLLKNIIDSFESVVGVGIGLPLGNLTSQLFANIYMNEFDRWVKHKLKEKDYVRYADDFILLSEDKEHLISFITKIGNFLKERLKLSLHPGKIILKTVSSGIDFLGWSLFPDHRILRRTTCRRMLERIKESPTNATLNSYLGLLKHGNAKKVREKIIMSYWLFKE